MLPQYIQSTCATSGDGLYEGLEWLSTSLRKAGHNWRSEWKTWSWRLSLRKLFSSLMPSGTFSIADVLGLSSIGVLYILSTLRRHSLCICHVVPGSEYDSSLASSLVLSLCCCIWTLNDRCLGYARPHCSSVFIFILEPYCVSQK